jgi:hypothetical protein
MVASVMVSCTGGVSERALSARPCLSACGSRSGTGRKPVASSSPRRSCRRPEQRDDPGEDRRLDAGDGSEGTAGEGAGGSGAASDRQVRAVDAAEQVGRGAALAHAPRGGVVGREGSAAPGEGGGGHKEVAGQREDELGAGHHDDGSAQHALGPDPAGQPSTAGSGDDAADRADGQQQAIDGGAALQDSHHIEDENG